jgi:hypothetical protein
MLVFFLYYCNYVFKNNYMFRLMMAIVRLPWEYLRATVSYIARIMQRSLHVQLARCDKAQRKQTENKSQIKTIYSEH